MRTPYKTYSAAYLAAEWLKTMEKRRRTMKQQQPAAAEAAKQAEKPVSPSLPEVNEATVVGRIANTPRCKDYGEGKERAQFSLAVPRPRRKDDAKPFYDYISVVAWGAIARQSEKLGKNDGVEVSGRIRTWVDPDNKRPHWEIAAESMQVLDRTPRVDADEARGTAAVA